MQRFCPLSVEQHSFRESFEKSVNFYSDITGVDHENTGVSVQLIKQAACNYNAL